MCIQSLLIVSAAMKNSVSTTKLDRNNERDLVIPVAYYFLHEMKAIFHH